MHRQALNQAARVIVLGDDMRERIVSKGIAPEKVVVVRDGATVPVRHAGPAGSCCGRNTLWISFRSFARREFGLLRSLGHVAQSCPDSSQRRYRPRVCRRRGKPRLDKRSCEWNTEHPLFAVSASRAGAARHDGRRFARDHGTPWTRRRCCAEQALFDLSRRTPRARRSAREKRCGAHRRRIGLRFGSRSRRSAWPWRKRFASFEAILRGSRPWRYGRRRWPIVMLE